MSKMLVGYTGFVGSNLAQQIQFEHLVNSKNISEFSGSKVDELIISAGDARKWLANKEPENDLMHINKLFTDISKIESKKVLLFSTVDVYEDKNGVYEGDFKVTNQPYGKHRWQFEQKIIEYFDNVRVIRLPGLFGNGLKKNIIFDIIAGRDLSCFNPNSAFQWFNLIDLRKIIYFCEYNEISELNVTAEPVTVTEVCNIVGVDLTLLDESAPLIKYNICSTHAEKYSGHTDYLYSKGESLLRIKQFITELQK